LFITEPSPARQYFDKGLLAPVDLSHVNWIMTANYASRLPDPLRSRFDIVELTAPGSEYFDTILANLFRGLAADWGVPVITLPTIDADIEHILRRRFVR